MLLLKHLENLWTLHSSGIPPALSEVFMECCEADQQQLVQALKEDQRRRWQTAWPLRVEEYL